MLQRSCPACTLGWRETRFTCLQFVALRFELSRRSEHALTGVWRWRQGTGQTIAYLSPATAVGRVVAGIPQIIAGGRFFDKAGNRVELPGAVYDSSGVRQRIDQLVEELRECKEEVYRQ